MQLVKVFTIPQVEELRPKAKPSYAKPTEIASFSYDRERNWHSDCSQLKIYRPEANSGFFQSKYADLNHGSSTFIGKPDDYQDHLEGLILALQSIEKTGKPADFVTWRGVFTKLFSTPFKRSESWHFNVMRRGTTIYMEPEKGLKETRSGAKHAAATYWGHRFEHVIMTSFEGLRESLEQRFNTPVNTWAEFGIVIKSKLGSHSIILGAEVDGLDSDGESYLELKTSRQVRDQQQLLTLHETKFLSFWLQSFLAGVPRLLIGFRSDRGVIQSLEYQEIAEIPRKVRGRVSWCPETILNFGNMFLDWLANEMRNLPENRVFRIDYVGDYSITLTEMDECAPFIPDEFTDAFYC